jgi:hypothetical protein
VLDEICVAVHLGTDELFHEVRMNNTAGNRGGCTATYRPPTHFVWPAREKVDEQGRVR